MSPQGDRVTDGRRNAFGEGAVDHCLASAGCRSISVRASTANGHPARQHAAGYQDDAAQLTSGCLDRLRGPEWTGLPTWEVLAGAYLIPYGRLKTRSGLDAAAVRCLLDADGPALVEVRSTRTRSNYPKISSAVHPDCSMRSNPLHRMSPDPPAEVEEGFSCTSAHRSIKPKQGVVVSINIRVTPRTETRCCTLDARQCAT